MTALHLDVKLDLEVVNLQKGEQRSPDMLRMNPNGKVPVLEDEGFLLWESHAIMQYLADRTPGQTVYPVELRARADVNRWLFWSANHGSPSVSILNWENFVKALIGAGAPDPAQGERPTRAPWTEPLSVVTRVPSSPPPVLVLVPVAPPPTSRRSQGRRPDEEAGAGAGAAEAQQRNPVE